MVLLVLDLLVMGTHYSMLWMPDGMRKNIGKVWCFVACNFSNCSYLSENFLETVANILKVFIAIF